MSGILEFDALEYSDIIKVGPRTSAVFTADLCDVLDVETEAVHESLNNRTSVSGFADEVRLKKHYPRNYDPIVQILGGKKEANSTIYTDRLYGWDNKKHDELCLKHFGNTGQYWDSRDGKKIQAFLKDWCDDKSIQLTRVTEYCNVATGYPTWRLDYFHEVKEAVGVTA